MKDKPANPYLVHQEILLVLPWYVNKTLHDPEMKAVENHLKVCLICKREIAMLQKLSLAVKSADTLESAAQASFSRLKNRIHQSEQPALPPVPKQPAPTQHRKWFQKLGLDSFSQPRPAFAMMSIAMLLVLVPAYYVADKMHKDTFRTLSSSETPAINNNEIKVIFQEGMSAQQKNKILDSVHGRIVDGPTPEGVYLIRISLKPDTGTIVDSLSSLRKNSNVIFAEPAYALLSPSEPGGTSK